MGFGEKIRGSYCICSLVLAVTLNAGSSRAAVVLGSADHADDAYCVTFDRVGIVDPVVTFSDVPGVGDLTVSFGTHFVGQTLGSSSNSLLDTSPLPPLRLSPNGTVKTLVDLASPTGIMLGGVQGNTLFTTPLAVLFSSGVSQLAFDLGHLDENTPTQIEFFGANGDSLGILDQLSPGYDTYSFGSDDNEDVISGVSIYVPDGEMDWEGFGINNIKFVVDGGGEVPEPATLLVWSILTGCGVSIAWWRRYRGRKIG